MASGMCCWIELKEIAECPYVGGGYWNRMTITEVKKSSVQHHVESQGKDLDLDPVTRKQYHMCHGFMVWKKDDFVGDPEIIHCSHGRLENEFGQEVSAYKKRERSGD